MLKLMSTICEDNVHILCMLVNKTTCIQAKSYINTTCRHPCLENGCLHSVVAQEYLAVTISYLTTYRKMTFFPFKIFTFCCWYCWLPWIKLQINLIGLTQYAHLHSLVAILFLNVIVSSEFQFNALILQLMWTTFSHFLKLTMFLQISYNCCVFDIAFVSSFNIAL